ncbi:MAG TPA: crossover junction endodeoxyribonuclease RuvC [Candidatus Polarisedimenticolia bacterium]|nr:crossover junction endodeoxyribonuclease RuvC [Candidatus Polarisedimenticolia bacterium]
MLILGIDPGSNATGYGLVESRAGRLTAITFGIIAPPRGLEFLERLPHIATALEQLLVETRPEAVAVEDLFHARNSRVALQLGHVRGAALLPLLKAGMPVHQYAPRLIKKAVAGYGGAEKEQVRRMVQILLGIRDSRMPLDASDALAVAICHAHSAPALRVREAAHA